MIPQLIHFKKDHTACSFGLDWKLCPGFVLLSHPLLPTYWLDSPVTVTVTEMESSDWSSGFGGQ